MLPVCLSYVSRYMQNDARCRQIISFLLETGAFLAEMGAFVLTVL
jgi:hypothetical protein